MTLDRSLGIASITVTAILGMIYAVTYALDRERREAGAAAAFAIAAMLVGRWLAAVDVGVARGIAAGIAVAFCLITIAAAVRGTVARGDAAIFVVGGALAAAPIAIDARAFPLVLALLSRTVMCVLARQHVSRRRGLELATDELRHQVAVRSRELADALGRYAATTELPAGRVIEERYRVVRCLGAGGMGAADEVERASDQQRLALKVLRRRSTRRSRRGSRARRTSPRHSTIHTSSPCSTSVSTRACSTS